MKPGLLEQIKERGHWRVNFQPVTIITISKLQDCKEIIEKSAVSLRGWNYPHIPHKNDESQGMEPCGGYHEGWADFGAHKEFWRIYKSSQFLYYRALREDWFAEDGWYSEYAKTIKPFTVLATVSAIYEVTEIFEFLSRLVSNGLYQDGVVVNISLHKTGNRELWLEVRNRMSFYHPRKTGAKELSFTQTLSQDDVVQSAKELANKTILELFDSFGWNPTSEQIMKDQEKLLSGKS